jgi:hypothetical protein
MTTILQTTLGRLVGGEWHYVPNGPDDPIQMRHRFAWELDGQVMVARSFNPAADPPMQISSDIWYWHPLKKTICSMGVVMFGPDPSLFEYTDVHLEGDTLVCDFSTFDNEGQGDWRETWQFTGANYYAWMLYKHTPAGPEKVRTGAFERKS